jgi:hypothetical protein
MEKVGRRAHGVENNGGCLDRQNGLYFREHFFLSLGNELARLDRYQKAVGLLAFRFLTPEPAWEETGPKINLSLGSCDQAARLDDALGAILLPESDAGKAARILGDLNRDLGPQVEYGLALIWPGHMGTADLLLARATQNMAGFEEAMKNLTDEHGPWLARNTALILAEKESLFEGFGQLLADG